MLIQYDSLYEVMTSLLKSGKFGSHQARLKSLSELLQGLLCSVQAGLSGMGRGSVLVNRKKSFRGQLQRAFRLLNNKAFDCWEIGKALYERLTGEQTKVLISVDWTQVGRLMVLEASLVVEGRGIPFYSLCSWKEELKGRQRAMELTMEYALASMRKEGQTLYVTVDRGFAALDYLGPSELYPFMRRINRLTRKMILRWDTIAAPLEQWPLYEGEVVEIEKARLGRKKKVLCGVVLANIGEPCYLACHPEDTQVALRFYQTRVWIEEQNRDLKTHFKVRVLLFHRQFRMERMWTLLGIAFALAYAGFQKRLGQEDRLSRKYKDGRKDLSWLSASKYLYQFEEMGASFIPLTA